MSASQTSNPASFQSSVGVTSTEELAEKYQKLFTEFSRIKAQHSVLKKAVIKERATNDTLKEECKTKEQELRISLQQLDLLTFHNQRLTKRIECLQEPTTLVKRLSPVWLMGSAKKELEKSKTTLETISKELQRKIEENEKLHKELFDVNSTYAEHENDLKEKISKLEKFNEEIQLELKRSGDASEEALSTIRREKSELENELDQTKNDLRITKSLIERNEQNLKKSDDYIQAEIDALKEILFINLGLTHEGDNGIQFNELGDKMDPESREIIASFKQLQSSARDYLKSIKDKSGKSQELGLKVKKASQSWQNSLQLLATKLSNAQDRVSELTTEKEILVKTNEADSNKVTNLEAEINRLKEELAKQKENVLYTEKGFNDSEDEEYTMISGENENEESLSSSFSLSKKKSNNNISENSNHHRQLQQKSSLDGNNEDEYLEVKMEDDQSNNISITNEMFDGTEINGTSSDLASIRRDIGRVVKSDDSKQREGLIHKNYEIKIQKLTEKLQYADSKCLRLSKALKTVQARMVEFESIIKNNAQENENSQTEITLLRVHWQNSLQLLATKLSNAQDRVSELTTEKEILVKTNEADSNKVTNLEAEINRLKEELAKQKENVLYTEKGFNDSEDEEYTMISGENENEESLSSSFSLSKKKSNNNISENSNHHRQLQQKSSLDGNNEDEYLEVKMEDDQSNNISITNEMFDGTEINGTSSDLASIRRDIGRVVKSDDSKQREGLIHKNYEIKIQKLTEKLQYADSKCLRLSKALKTVQARMVEFESIIKNNAQENENSQTEITLLRTKLDEERANYERQFHEMTDYIEQQSVTIKDLNDRLAEVEDEFQFQEHS
ncbi:5865_t:CDS:10 [Entrophospora sp. SA101]|nr:5865_t:CDS:10 [Entrophospora sp. SA101]